MKSVFRFVCRIPIPTALVALVLASGCSSSQVIFDGVALVRVNGDVIVVQRADSVQALFDSSLGLTTLELQLLESLAARRDQAHASAGNLESEGQTGRCLTGTGNPPQCYPVLPCKGCKLVSQGLTADGQLSTVREDAGSGTITIPFAAPYAYYCECDTW